jgi:hypothetical protein
MKGVGEKRKTENKEQTAVSYTLFRFFKNLFTIYLFSIYLTLSDPTSDLVRQYDFPVLLRCRKTSDTVFVAFVLPLSEPVRRFYSCSTDVSQQIAQVLLFVSPCFSLIKL